MSETNETYSPPRLLRLANALAGALVLDGTRTKWTTDEPWTDADSTADDFIAEVVLLACAEAERILGRAGLMPEHDEDLLTRQVMVEAFAFGCDLDSFNEVELRSRIRVALEVVREDSAAEAREA